MFRYTPNSQMLKEYRFVKSRKYDIRSDFCPYYAYIKTKCNSNYSKMLAFMLHWEYTEFYSRLQRTQIPVNGILFPIKYFDVVEITDEI